MGYDSEITHGVDLETFSEFAKFAGDNPDAVQFGLSASATYEGTCAHSLASVNGYTLGGERIERETRGYRIPYGGWREVLETAGWVGATDRLEPIEAALSALAACLNVGVSINALAHGVDIESLETSVSVDFDPAVLFGLAGIDESDTVFENVTADIEVDGTDVDPDLIDEWARRAPVYTLISLAQDIDIAVSSGAVEAPADD